MLKGALLEVQTSTSQDKSEGRYCSGITSLLSGWGNAVWDLWMFCLSKGVAPCICLPPPPPAAEAGELSWSPPSVSSTRELPGGRAPGAGPDTFFFFFNVSMIFSSSPVFSKLAGQFKFGPSWKVVLGSPYNLQFLVTYRISISSDYLLFLATWNEFWLIFENSENFSQKALTLYKPNLIA